MRDSIYAIAHICHRNSVSLSVRLSHGWISQKRLKLGLCSFHHTVAPPLSFLQDKFHREILTLSPERGPQSRVGRAKKQYTRYTTAYILSYIKTVEQ